MNLKKEHPSSISGSFIVNRIACAHHFAIYLYDLSFLFTQVQFFPMTLRKIAFDTIVILIPHRSK